MPRVGKRSSVLVLTVLLAGLATSVRPSVAVGQPVLVPSGLADPSDLPPRETVAAVNIADDLFIVMQLLAAEVTFHEDDLARALRRLAAGCRGNRRIAQEITSMSPRPLGGEGRVRGYEMLQLFPGRSYPKNNSGQNR